MSFRYDPAFDRNDELAHGLLELTTAPKTPPDAEAAVEPAPETPRPSVTHLENADAIVSHIEVNNRHGVGVLLERLFSSYRNVLSIRSQNHFEGRQRFGDLDFLLSYEDTAPAAVREKVRAAIGDSTVGRILCVPYYPDDVRTALALRRIFGAPLCTYLMDDQNVFSDGIPDELMRQLLEASSLRLAISTELAICYERKYGCKMWLMPPVIPARHILSRPVPEDEALPEPKTGAILGNIWGQRWLDLLRETVRGSGVTLHWYSTNHLRYLSGSTEELARDGILIPPPPPLPDEDLIAVLRKTAFGVVPSGTLAADDDRRFIAQLSLPSRIPFLLATSQLPLLVLGSPSTAAARFVEELGIGLRAPYERGAFREAVAGITQPETNRAMRRRALAIAGRFTDTGAAEWIWQSLERGAPFDMRYEDLMRRPRPEIEQLVPSGRNSS